MQDGCRQKWQPPSSEMIKEASLKGAQWEWTPRSTAGPKRVRKIFKTEEAERRQVDTAKAVINQLPEAVRELLKWGGRRNPRGQRTCVPLSASKVKLLYWLTMHFDSSRNLSLDSGVHQSFRSPFSSWWRPESKTQSNNWLDLIKREEKKKRLWASEVIPENYTYKDIRTYLRFMVFTDSSCGGNLAQAEHRNGFSKQSGTSYRKGNYSIHMPT